MEERLVYSSKVKWDKGGSGQGWTGSRGFIQQADFVLKIMGCTGQVKHGKHI